LGVRLVAVLAPLAPSLKTGPNEADLFGSDRAGCPLLVATQQTTGGGSRLRADDTGTPDGGVDRHCTELSSGTDSSRKFDTDEAKSDPLKVGAQPEHLRSSHLFQEQQPFESGSFGAPSDSARRRTWMGAPPIGCAPSCKARACSTTRLALPREHHHQHVDHVDDRHDEHGLSLPGVSGVGLTPATSTRTPASRSTNSGCASTSLRRVYLTVGRQKVRWGVGAHLVPDRLLERHSARSR
jgi:hypothetical protein